MSLTGAGVIIAIAVVPIFPVPQQIQGFAPDDVYDIPQLKMVEAMIGVDGLKSSGWVAVLVPMTITLMGDSLSNDFFDTWATQNQAAQTDYTASGLIRLPSIGKKITLTNGSLTGWKPAPAVKKLLQPRQYEITWQSALPSPA